MWLGNCFCRVINMPSCTGNCLCPLALQYRLNTDRGVKDVQFYYFEKSLKKNTCIVEVLFNFFS